jgi:hypothetical protein
MMEWNGGKTRGGLCTLVFRVRLAPDLRSGLPTTQIAAAGTDSSEFPV